MVIDKARRRVNSGALLMARKWNLAFQAGLLLAFCGAAAAPSQVQAGTSNAASETTSRKSLAEAASGSRSVDLDALSKVDPRIPKTPDEREFHAKVVREIHRVIPYDADKFALAFAKRASPAFPGARSDSLEEVECERLAAVNVIGYATIVGHIAIADCSRNREKIQRLAEAAESQPLLKGPGETVYDRKAGFYYAMERLAKGSTFYYFPVFVVGHGLASGFHGVLVSPQTERAVVVTAEQAQMCHNLRADYADSPMCRDLEGFLKAVAIAVARLQ